MWWIIDRRLVQEQTVDDEAALEELLILVDRLEHSQPTFHHVYSQAIRDSVIELEKRGFVIRWGD